MRNGTRPRYRVVTGIAPPYVMYNNTSGAFYGYCIDLLVAIGSFAGFDYAISESFDKHYGHRDPITGRWNGLVYELMKNTSDIGVGPIWITSDRSQVIDYTIPYQRQSGFTIMMLKEKRQIPFLRFLMILEIEVWLALAFAFLLNIFLLFVLEKYSPFSYRNNREKYRDEPDDRFCSLRGCFWFVFTSITPQGGGDVPKNLSGKVAAATWWLLAFFIAAAYSANLAAYEMLERLERNIESLDDLTRQYRVQYSTLANSTAYRYFRKMRTLEDRLHSIWRQMSLDDGVPERNRSEYAVWDYPLEEKFTKMYVAMEETGFVPNVERALELMRGSNRSYEFAFIEEATAVKYLMLTSCDFRQVGEEFAKKSFAFAVQKGSRLKRMLDDAITRLAIEGKLKELEKKWWDENPSRVSCPVDKDFNAGFGLDNLGMAFLSILAGIFLAILILCLQYFCYRYRVKQWPKKTHPFTGRGEEPIDFRRAGGQQRGAFLRKGLKREDAGAR